MKDLQINDIFLVQSTVDPNTFYFSDENNEYYWTVKLEDTDDFLEFIDWLDQTYDATITDPIKERLEEQFQTDF